MEPWESERAVSPNRRGLGAAIVVVVVAVAATVGIGIVRSVGVPAEEIPVLRDDPAALGAPDRVHVHIAGAVPRPGLYVLSSGARVVDAVAAAGGFADDADAAALNLARELSDGEQLIVGVAGETPAGTGAPVDGRINLNLADEALLDTLPRIGPALAERIVRWREVNGSFTSVEDLLAVPGIGAKLLEGLRDRVTV